jgi:hypothetical protein
MQLLERRRPCTADGHDLRPVHEAEPVVRDHLGLLLAPLGQCGRPLAGAAYLADVSAKRGRVAVDDAGDDGRELARRNGDHGLVHQPQAAARPAESDERVALLHQADRDEIAIPEAFADLRRLGRRRARCLEVPARRLLEKYRDQEVSAL